MKRLLTLILVLISVASFAWPIAKQIEVRPGSILGWDNASATWRPVAVNPDTGALETVGSVTVDQNKTEVVSVTSAAQSVASVTNRKSILIINHSDSETIWVSLDSATASAAVNIGIPVFPYGAISRELDSSKVVGLVTTTTASATVYQDGY